MPFRVPNAARSPFFSVENGQKVILSLAIFCPNHGVHLTSLIDKSIEEKQEQVLRRNQLEKDESIRREKAKTEAIATENKRRELIAQAETALRSKNIQHAYTKYSEAHSIGALSDSNLVNYIFVSVQRGKELERAKDFNESENIFKSALSLDSKNVEAQRGLDRVQLATATAPPVPKIEKGWFDFEEQPEQVFNDVFTYNEQTFNKKVNKCKIIDKEATCAGKGKGYIVECNGSDQKFKWFKINVGEGQLTIYTLPKDYNDYHCNSSMDHDSKLSPRIKRGDKWKCENASPDWAPPHCGG